MKRFLLFVLLSVASGASAQRQVSGSVRTDDGRPLAGATVAVEERPGLGVATDARGRYTLTLPDHAVYTLTASFLGCETRRERVAAGRREVNFRLPTDERQLDVVVVTGTRTPKLLKDAPIVTRVIPLEEIKRADATHIGDLLQSELPGVEFSYVMNQQTQLNMAGFGGNSVLFLVDGERLAGETMDNIDYSRLNMDNVGRIEIVKGAASSLYGSNAVGGVVNVISRTSEEPWSVNLNARYGAHNEQRYGATVGFRAGGLNSMTNLQRTSVDAIDLAKGASDEAVGDYSKIYASSTWNVKERLVWTPIERLKLTARAGYFFRERDYSESLRDRYRDFSGGLKGNYDFGTGGDLELSYSFDQYDKSDYLTASKRDVRDYSNVQHILRAAYNYAFAEKHLLTVGGDWMRDYLLSYQFDGDGHHRQATADAFAQFDWNPTRRFNLVAGVRYDWFSESGLQRVSPKLSLMYKFENCSLRGSYAAGFRAPTLKEMYMNFDMASIFMIYGNPALKPEKSHNFSLSAEYMKGGYNLTLTGYHNLVDHRIATAWSRELKGQLYTNMAPLRISGIDANASARWSCGLGARISYAYTYEHIRKGEPLLSATRPHTATARLSYDRSWKNYGLSVALNGRWLSRLSADEYTSATSYEETVRVNYPAYSIWKLTLTQRLWRGIDLTLAVDNLFNYRPSYYYSNSPTTIGTTCSAGLSIDIERLFK